MASAATVKLGTEGVKKCWDRRPRPLGIVRTKGVRRPPREPVPIFLHLPAPHPARRSMGSERAGRAEVLRSKHRRVRAMNIENAAKCRPVQPPAAAPTPSGPGIPQLSQGKTALTPLSTTTSSNNPAAAKIRRRPKLFQSVPFQLARREPLFCGAGLPAGSG